MVVVINHVATEKINTHINNNKKQRTAECTVRILNLHTQDFVPTSGTNFSDPKIIA